MPQEGNLRDSLYIQKPAIPLQEYIRITENLKKLKPWYFRLRIIGYIPEENASQYHKRNEKVNLYIIE